MLTLPLPVVVSLALIYTAVRVWFGGDQRRVHPLVALMVLAVAAQSLLVALVQHYGLTGLRWWQPVTASALPPLVWSAFVAVQVRPLRASDLWHGAAPLLVVLAVLYLPVAIDWLVMASFVAYGVAMLMALRPGVRELPLSRLASDQVPRRLWRLVAVSLLVSALGDALIFWGQLMQWDASRGVLISVMSSLMLLAIGSVGLSAEWRMPLTNANANADTSDTSDTDARPAVPHEHPLVEAADAALLARLDAHMREDRPWLNPDLTLVALARKLGVPSKALSAVVNQGHGENVARFVNRFRIEHACTLLLAGEPVTSAMYASGFNTKSNFHREFLRIHGQTPTLWLAHAGPQACSHQVSNQAPGNGSE